MLALPLIILLTFNLSCSSLNRIKPKIRDLASKIKKTIVMPNHGMKAKKVAVSFLHEKPRDYSGEPDLLGKAQSSFVKKLASILHKINLKSNKNISLVLATDKNDMVEVENFIKELPVKVEISEYISEDYRHVWLQDIGEFAFYKDINSNIFEPLFIELNRADSNSMVKGVLKTLNSKSIRLANEPHQGVNYGGNIEATPNNILVLGGPYMNTGIVNLFKENGYKQEDILQVNSQFLAANHIDEMFTTVPVKNDSCGFAIVKPNLIKGLEALRSLTEQELKKIPKSYYNYDITDINNRGNFSPTEAGLSYRHHYLTKSEPIYVKEFEDNQRRAQLRIDEAIENLKKTITKKDPKCHDIKVLELPNAYACTYMKIDKFGVGGLWGCASVFTNQINLISLGSDSIVPDPFINKIRDMVKSEFNKISHSVHFIDTFLHNDVVYGGNAHCLTNVIRAPE